MGIYIVRRGDTIYNISRRFGISPEELAYANQLADPARLAVGMALYIPGYDEGARREIEVNAYAYPNISPAAYEAALPYLSFICPFDYSATAEGELRAIDDAALIAGAYAASAAPLMTVTNLSEDSGFSSDIAHAILTNEGAQARLFDNILATLRAKRYYGINFNIEYVYPFDKDAYNDFLKRAEARFHPLGYYLTSAIAPKESDTQSGLLYSAHDYAAHGRYMDRVVIMTYEWGHTYGAPQAVSPVDKLRHVLDYAVTRIPSGKILMGFSNYGYSWRLPWRQGEAARLLSNAAAAELAAAVNAEIHYDAVAAASYFYYTDASGVRRVVWFEDARSVRARLSLVGEYALAGISIWTIDRLYRPGLETLNSSFAVEKLI